MRYAIAWLVLIVVVTVEIGSLNWPSYRRLAARGVTGQGEVVELLPKIHNTVRYKYQVRGQTFQGQMQSRQPNPSLDQLRVSQAVVIYYDPEHPEKSVLGDPTPIFWNETISVTLAAVAVPTFVVASWVWRTARRRAK